MKAFLPWALFVAAPAAAQSEVPVAPGEVGSVQQPMPESAGPGTSESPGSWAPLPEPPRYVDPRLREIPYDPDAVIPLAVAPGRQMTVLFSTGEKIQSVAVGDSGSWQVTASRAGDSLFVKPTSATGATNMTVITDSRTYLFDLSTGEPWDSVYLARFVYLENVDAEAEQLAPAQAHGRGTYRIRGDRALRPDAISDDGSKTYIAWGERKAMPAVFAIGPAGDEMVVDGYVRRGLYTIDRVYTKLIFRFDRKTATAVRK